MKISKPLICACILFTTVLNLSCEAKSNVEPSLQEKYGADTDYFVGLKALQEKDNKAALKFFNKAISHGSKYVSRRSLEQKILLGNIQQQIEGAKEYLQKYNDDAGLLFACKIFYDSKENASIIEATNAVDISTCPNELAKMRISALHDKADSRLNETTCGWFLSRKISPEHIEFYYDNLSEVQTDNEKIISMLKVIKFRVLAAEKNFSDAYNLIEEIKTIFLEQRLIPLTYQIVADIGRTYYATSMKYSENAKFFLELSESDFAINPKIKYYSLIYAGRLYNKSGVYLTKAETAFTDALNCAPNDEDYDMALWFLLNSRLSGSTEKCISTLEEFCGNWKNPYYFTDILDNLSLLLFTSAKWESFSRVYKILDGHADNATTSRFAYLTGKLIQQKLLKGTKEEMNAAFTKAYELNAGTDVYYRLLAAKQLGLSKAEIERTIFSSTVAESAKNDYEAEKLLTGYADFGFEELIYPEWTYFYTLNNNIFGIEAVCYVAKFLRSCGNSENNNFYKSLHMVTKTTNLDNSRLSREVFELSYPKNFGKEIAAACKEFEVEEYDMLGLIRTESFFNPIVESHAGALGLSQLMGSTFADCAERLKIENPDITDPMTNIRLGTYYYSDLVKRLDNSDILALFAYNAGITRVRRWLKSSKVGLGILKNLPSDLFLETIPFAETRNYGRKVISSAAIYAWLYYEKNPCDVIDEMM